jgi:flagellar assembly protein FliH
MSRTVLKSGQLQAASRGGCNVDLRDISQQAREMLDAARAQAVRLTDENRRQSEQRATQALQAAQKNGFEDGFAKGRETGYATALEEARKAFAAEQRELVTTLRNMVDAIRTSRERLLVEARQDCLTLAIAIGSRVIHDLTGSGENASAAAIEACREALELISAQTDVVIRAHPDDCEALERFCGEAHAGLQSSRHVKLVPNSGSSRAGVIVETADSRVDATVDEKIRRIADELVADWKARMAKLSLHS